MKKQTDYNVTLSGGTYKNINIKPDGSVTILMEILGDAQPTVETKAGITFTCIPVSSITQKDDFMWYVPSSSDEIKFKERIENIFSKKTVLEDFLIPVDYTEIKLFGDPIKALYYGSASCDTWIRNAEANSWKILRISQYISLLAWMIKILVEKEGWKHKKAWKAICENSELLLDLDWETIFGFKNFLTGANKYLLPDDPFKDKGCFMASGGLNDRDWNYPLAQITKDSRRDCNLKDASYSCYGFISK